MSVALTYAARSDLGLGSKSRNEDSAYAGPELLVLCDGMGGHAAGDAASSLIVGELVQLDGEAHGGDDLASVLRSAIVDANRRLGELSESGDDLHGMGTTCIAMLRSGNKLAVANIGDSRAYLLRRGRLSQITTDHSFVQQLLDEGRITEDEAAHHPQRFLVTRVLTGQEDDSPDVSMRELAVGDRILICSDGLSDYVARDTIADILSQDLTPGQVADRLVQIGLRAGTRDNITVIVADAVAPGEGATNAQVVGAASERHGATVFTTPQTPAEKAAALSREVRGAGTEDPGRPVLAEESASPRAALVRRTLVLLAALVVFAAGGWAAYGWSQQQYFVGDSEGQVAIFRGVSQDLGPLALSSLEEETGPAVADLPRYYRQQVENTLSADDRADADRIVDELRRMSSECDLVPILPLPGDGSATDGATAGPGLGEDPTATAPPGDGTTSGPLATTGPGEATQSPGSTGLLPSWELPPGC